MKLLVIVATLICATFAEIPGININAGQPGKALPLPTAGLGIDLNLGGNGGHGGAHNEDHWKHDGKDGLKIGESGAGLGIDVNLGGEGGNHWMHDGKDHAHHHRLHHFCQHIRQYCGADGISVTA